MPKLIVTRGVSGSGKSFWARKEAALTGAIVSERDMIRERLYGSRKMNNTDEAKITKMHHAEVGGFLQTGLDVIVSDTNIRDKYVRDFAKIAWLYGAEFEQNIFIKTLEECKKQNNLREGDEWLDDETVIEKQFNKFSFKEADVSDIIFDVEPYNPNPAWYDNSIVLFDIDGTSFNIGNRSPFEWHKVHLDTPRWDVLGMAGLLAQQEDIELVFLSGRDKSCFETTHRMLCDALGPKVGFELYMRKEKDNRPDTIVKYELFNDLIRPSNTRIYGVFDDRAAVAVLWEKLGLTVFNVGKFGQIF